MARQDLVRYTGDVVEVQEQPGEDVRSVGKVRERLASCLLRADVLDGGHLGLEDLSRSAASQL